MRMIHKERIEAMLRFNAAVDAMITLPKWGGNAVCRKCGAVVNGASRFVHYNWHKKSEERKQRQKIMYETVMALWGDT